METLDSPILLSRSLEKCVADFVAPLSGILFQFVPFLACKCYTDRECFIALFASSISFPDREETHTWSGNNFFLVAECARGCYVLHNV